MKLMKIAIFALLLIIPYLSYADDISVTTTNDVAPGVTLDGTITNVVNTELSGTDVSYTYFQLAASGYSQFTLQYTIEATTLTIEGSNDRFSVPDASATWSDITTELTGSSSITSSGSLTVSNKIPWPRLRIKRATSNATNSLVLKLTRAKF